jgi:hypothetical protein
VSEGLGYFMTSSMLAVRSVAAAEGGGSSRYRENGVEAEIEQLVRRLVSGTQSEKPVRRLVVGPAAWARRRLDVQRAVEDLCGRCSASVARCACPGWRIAGWVRPGMGRVLAGSGLPSSPRPARVPLPASDTGAERLAGVSVAGGVG